MAKVTCSVSLEENLRNVIADRAEREERSFSAMLGWLAERGLEEPGAGRRVLPAAGALRPRRPAPGFEGVSFDLGAALERAHAAVPSRPKSKRERTMVCEHRLPPGSWCRWCDG